MTPPEPPFPPSALGSFVSQPSFDLPVGAVIAFAGAIDGQVVKADGGIEGVGRTSPIEACGWLPCDGKDYDPGQYPELFAALGYLYGKAGDRFHVPDLSGQFIRGLDDGSVDKDFATRTRQTTGKPYSGEAYTGVGSREPDAFQEHQHNYTPAATSSADGSGASATPGSPAATDLPITPSSGDDKARYSRETRPVNVYMNYLIKFTNIRIVPPTI